MENGDGVNNCLIYHETTHKHLTAHRTLSLGVGGVVVLYYRNMHDAIFYAI